MTGAPGSDHPSAEPSTEIKRSRRSLFVYAAPVAAIVVAGIAVGAAYLIGHTSTPRSSTRLTDASLPAPAYPTPTLAGALSPQTGPDGTAWQWIGETASLDLTGVGRGWIAFRASSPRVRRTLTFTGPTGERAAVRIASAPGVYLAGPLAAGRVVLRASPAVAVKPGRPPTLSVFLSTLRVLPNPVAVLPGSGFWSTENSGGVVFNWLKNSGLIDIYAPRSPSGRVWLTFVARSLGGKRTLTAQSAQTTKRVAVTTTAQPVTVGPFRLVDGRAHVSVHPSPGARRYGADPRSLSVQVASLAGYTTSADA